MFFCEERFLIQVLIRILFDGLVNPIQMIFYVSVNSRNVGRCATDSPAHYSCQYNFAVFCCARERAPRITLFYFTEKIIKRYIQ